MVRNTPEDKSLTPMNMEVVPTDVTHDLFSGSTGLHVNVDASKRDVGPPSNRFDIFGQVMYFFSHHVNDQSHFSA